MQYGWLLPLLDLLQQLPIEDDNECLGSGRPFLGCSHLNKAILPISFTD